MKNGLLLCSLFLVSSAGTALAAETKLVNLEELKEKCDSIPSDVRRSSLGQLDLKFSVTINCGETSTYWRSESKNKNVCMSNDLATGFGASMKDGLFVIPYSYGTIATSDNCVDVACVQFVKVKKVIAGSIEKVVTCDELKTITSLQDFCASHVKVRKDSDSNLAISETVMSDTIIDTCGGTPTVTTKPCQDQAGCNQVPPIANNPQVTDPIPSQDGGSVVSTQECQTVSDTNIRSTPWTVSEDNVVGQLATGASIKPISMQGNFYKFTYQGKTAYIHKSMLNSSCAL